MADDLSLHCSDCGQEMTVAIEDFAYELSEAEHVVLKGVEVHRCECGVIKLNLDLEGVRQKIANYLLNKSGKLNLQQARFMLTYLLDRMEGWPYVDIIGQG